MNCPFVTLETSQFGAARHVPKAQSPLAPRRKDAPPAREKIDDPAVAFVALEGPYFLAGPQVPEVQGFVVPAGDGLGAVGREGDATAGRIPFANEQFFAGFHLPQPHRAVVA